MIVSMTPAADVVPEMLDRVGHDQLGYAATGPKAVVVADSGSAQFQVLDLAGKAVFTGELGPALEWDADGVKSRRADWSAVTAAGDYRLEIPAYGVKLPVHVATAPWAALAQGLLKAYYFQRASIDLEAKYAGPWARKAGHPDDSVLVHASAASPTRPEGTVLSSPKGWYDAGDYNKYIVNSGISVYTLLAIHEHHPDYAKRLALNIPESGGPLPDLLAEVKWNLDWMLTMQDPADGGVYHKLTNLRFDPFIMPEQCHNPRHVVMKTTAASLDFAAVMAQASRVYAPFDAVFAARCLAQARHAHAWAQAHPQVFYRQPEDVRTGRYEDEHLDDERQWAACELYATTGEAEYLQQAKALGGEHGVPSWQRVATLGMVTLAVNKQEPWARGKVLELADTILARQARNAYAMGMLASDFVWGSNGVAANQGMVLMVAHLLTGEAKYRDGAVHVVDYLLGANPMRTSFVTGFGIRSPMHPHHRPSEADGAIAPVPGLLVGGPNPGRQDQKNCPAYPSSAPSMAYLDNLCSYASNEIAINWNAPAAYLASALQASFGE